MNQLTRVASNPLATQADRFIEMIERVCTDPDADLDKLDRMLAMREREQQRAATLAFNVALARAQAEMEPINVDSANPMTKSKYASYAALDRAARPAYTKHGFGLTFSTEPLPQDQILVTCDLSHSDGYTRRYSIPMTADGRGARGGDVMTKTHAMGSAVSYGMRYLLRMIFNLAIDQDRDDDGNMAGARTRPQQFQEARPANRFYRQAPRQRDATTGETIHETGGTPHDSDGVILESGIPGFLDRRSPATKTAGESAPSQDPPATHPESGADNDESRTMFVHSTEDHIQSFDDAKELADWWKSSEQKSARRDFGLNTAEVDHLVELVKARHGILTNGGNGK